MIAGYLTQKVTRFRQFIDDYGRSTGETELVLDARIENSRRTMRNANGEEFVSSARVFVGPSADIREGDTLILYQVETSGTGMTGGTGNTGGEFLLPARKWPVMRVDEIYGFSLSHKEVWV